jgi:hypothetical protein
VTLLLTGNFAVAEQVVIDCIETLDMTELLSDYFVSCASALAIERSWGNLRPDPDLLTGLPSELQRVLQLPPTLRHCFVLRILVGLSVGETARILHSNPSEVAESTAKSLFLTSIQHLPSCTTGSLGHFVFAH